jgi:hypothetical protein
MKVNTYLLRILTFLALTSSLATVSFAQSNTANSSTWLTDGSVHAIARYGSQSFIGGEFNYVGPRRPYGTALDPTTGQPVSGFPNPNGPVYAAISDGSGGWYIGGNFSSVGGEACQNIAHISSGGVVSTSFKPQVSGIIYAMALDGTTLFVGGSIAAIGETTISNFAALNTTNGALVTVMNLGASATVRAIAVRGSSSDASGSTVYVGGEFTTFGPPSPPSPSPSTRTRLASFNYKTGTSTTVALDDWNPAADGTVLTIALDGSRVFIGGEFTTIGGFSHKALAEFSGGASTPTTWTPDPRFTGFTSRVRTIAIDGSKLYVGGEFSTVNNGGSGGGTSNISNLAAFNLSDGSLDNGWNPNCGRAVHALAVTDATVYAAGEFTGIGDSLRVRIVALDKTQGKATGNWNTGASGTVYALAMNTGSAIYAGGDFLSIGGSLRQNLAALDDNGAVVTSFDARITGSTAVYALAVADDHLYFGGSFTKVSGVFLSNLAAWKLKGSPGTTGLIDWNPSPNSVVYALAVSNLNIYVGGRFTQVNSESRHRLAAFNRSTRVLIGSDPLIKGFYSNGNEELSSSVRAIAVHGTRVYVGGDFTNVGPDVGTDKRWRLAAFNDGATPSLDVSWRPSVQPDVIDAADYRFVRAIAVSSDGNTVYVGGQYLNVSSSAQYSVSSVGIGRLGLAAFASSNGDLLSLSLNEARTVNSMVRVGNTLYIAGNGVKPEGEISTYDLASVDLNANSGAGAFTTWAPDLTTTGEIYAISLAGSELLVGGNTSRSSVDFNMKSHLASYNIATGVSWVGGTGNWSNPDNWSPALVPGSTTDVTISSGSPVMDVDYTVGAGKSLTISGSGSLEIAAGKTLTVEGTANFGGSPVTLRSTASGTASIGQVTGVINGATNVTAERYIKQNANSGGTGRAWRLVSIPVTGSGTGRTLRDFFMNGRPGTDLTSEANRNLETANSGTPIVGHNHASASAANTAGFDWIGVANQVSSLRRYAGDGSGGTFLSGNVPDLSTTYEAADQGYMVFTRGDRKVVFPSPSNASVTTFRSTGTLKTGDQTVSVVPSGTSTYTLVGNPYMSVLDLSLLHADNSAVIKPGFWIWDANIAGTHKQGGYVRVSFNGTSWVTNTGAYTNPERIESGMAFFAEPIVGLSGATNITIREAHKSAATSAGIVPYGSESSDGHGLFYARLETPASGGVREVVDGVLIDFHKDFKESLGDLGDGEKLRNTISQGALWLSREGRNLVAEGLPWPGVDKRSIPLFMGSVGSQQRILRIDPRGMADRYVKAWLKDRHLNTETEVDMSKGLDYAFTGTGAAATDLERFELVFVEAGRPTMGGTAFEPGTGDEKPSVRLYPNPSGSSDVRLSLRSMPAGIYLVQVVDLKGSLLMNSRITHGGRNEEYRFLKGRRLPPGRYIVRLIDGKGAVKVLQMASE